MSTARMILVVTVCLAVGASAVCAAAGESRPPQKLKPGVVAPGAKLVEVGGGFQFTEGPAVDANGNVFFTDVRASRIHKWSLDGKPALFRTDTGGANGLFFDQKGNLVACEGDSGRIVSIDPKGKLTVLADKYGGKRFNKPNDLWVAPKGGVYFSDPMYGRAERTQDGEHVYYISPDRKKVSRVIDDMVRPNGLVGTPDGKTLYVTDAGGKKTYRYAVKADGTLAGKKLLAPAGGDGMTIDNEGNVYLAEKGILVFDPKGEQIARIDVPIRPTNVCFGGRDGRTLFITARTSVYSVRMRVRGVSGPAARAAKPGDRRRTR
jgi:gluconolactonase